MPVPVKLDDINDALKPWLGSLFLMSSSFSQDIAYQMMCYSPARETLAQLKDRLMHHVLVGLNRATKSSMCIMVENYQFKRLALRDLEWITDDLMGLIFEQLSPFSSNYDKLNEYALTQESLSALRVLYQKYSSYFTEEQFEFMIAMIKKLYPKERYRHWLSD